MGLNGPKFGNLGTGSKLCILFSVKNRFHESIIFPAVYVNNRQQFI